MNADAHRDSLIRYFADLRNGHGSVFLIAKTVADVLALQPHDVIYQARKSGGMALVTWRSLWAAELSLQKVNVNGEWRIVELSAAAIKQFLDKTETFQGGRYVALCDAVLEGETPHFSRRQEKL